MGQTRQNSERHNEIADPPNSGTKAEERESSVRANGRHQPRARFNASNSGTIQFSLTESQASEKRADQRPNVSLGSGAEELHRQLAPDKLGQRGDWRHLTAAHEEPSLLSLVVLAVTRMSLAKAVTSRRSKPWIPPVWGFLFPADPTGGHQTWGHIIRIAASSSLLSRSFFLRLHPPTSLLPRVASRPFTPPKAGREPRAVND